MITKQISWWLRKSKNRIALHIGGWWLPVCFAKKSIPIAIFHSCSKGHQSGAPFHVFSPVLHMWNIMIMLQDEIMAFDWQYTHCPVSYATYRVVGYCFENYGFLDVANFWDHLLHVCRTVPLSRVCCESVVSQSMVHKVYVYCRQRLQPRGNRVIPSRGGYHEGLRSPSHPATTWHVHRRAWQPHGHPALYG